MRRLHRPLPLLDQLHRLCGPVRRGRSPWHNPYRVTRHRPRDEAVEGYAAKLKGDAVLRGRLHELQGARLLCHCGSCSIQGEIHTSGGNKLFCTRPGHQHLLILFRTDTAYPSEQNYN